MSNLTSSLMSSLASNPMTSRIQTQLQSFLDSDLRNKWIGDSCMQVYVRKSKRYFDCKDERGLVLLSALDLATIEVDRDFQRQGRCADFISMAHRINPFDATFIECVSHDFLESHLLKNQYLAHHIPRCFFKFK